jgi:hypothetical protein
LVAFKTNSTFPHGSIRRVDPVVFVVLGRVGTKEILLAD